MARISRRLIGWVAAALAAGLLLAIATVVLVVMLVDPNEHKLRIEALAREQIGRDLKLTGTLSWRIAPWLVVESAGGTLSNPAGFEGPPFAAWQRLRLGLRLRPLLKREFIVDRIAIDGLDLRLRRNAAGQDNWSFASAPRAPDAAEPRLQVDALELTHARVSFDDDIKTAHWRAEDLALSLRLPAGATSLRVQAEKIELGARIFGGPLSAQGLTVGFDAPRVVYDGAAMSVQLAEFKAKLDDASVSGALDAGIGEALTAQGKLDVATPKLRELLLGLGVAVPATRDAGVIGRFTLASSFTVAADRFVTGGLALQMDETRIAGDLQMPSLEQGSIRFDLKGDSIDLDRYLEPEGTVSKPFELQLAQLKALDAAGQLTFERARLGGIAIVGLTLKVE